MGVDVKIMQDLPEKIKFSELGIGDGFQYDKVYFMKTGVYSQPEHTNAMCVTRYVKHGRRSYEIGELMTFDQNSAVIPVDMTIVIGKFSNIY